MVLDATEKLSIELIETIPNEVGDQVILFHKARSRKDIFRKGHNRTSSKAISTTLCPKGTLAVLWIQLLNVSNSEQLKGYGYKLPVVEVMLKINYKFKLISEYIRKECPQHHIKPQL